MILLVITKMWRHRMFTFLISWSQATAQILDCQWRLTGDSESRKPWLPGHCLDRLLSVLAWVDMFSSRHGVWQCGQGNGGVSDRDWPMLSIHKCWWITTTICWTHEYRNAITYIELTIYLRCLSEAEDLRFLFKISWWIRIKCAVWSDNEYYSTYWRNMCMHWVLQ